jgi:uncharacterized membrane protein
MRRAYLDWARGLAVLLMIEAHTTDAWTRAGDKSTAAFGVAAALGGFAAPLFLWLAGLSIALAAARPILQERGRAAQAEAICRRGLEIFILAFVFRLQAFIVTPGGHPVKIFRVDILNVMGPAIAAAGIVWGLAPSRAGRILSCAAAATFIAGATPIVRAARSVDTLPVWIQWYLRPAGEYTAFTMLPWAGFVFAGAACGALVAATRDASDEGRLQTWLAMFGAGLVALGWYTSTRPSIYQQSSFWTSSPTWFAIRVGLLMIGVSALHAVGRLGSRLQLTWGPLERLGRSSLFVYWIHVELVYGYASWLWRGRLPLWGAALGCVAFSALMYGTVIWRDRLVERWRSRSSAGSLAQPLTT